MHKFQSSAEKEKSRGIEKKRRKNKVFKIQKERNIITETLRRRITKKLTLRLMSLFSRTCKFSNGIIPVGSLS